MVFLVCTFLCIMYSLPSGGMHTSSRWHVG